MRMWFGGLLIGIALGMWIERAFVWNAARLQRKLDSLNAQIAARASYPPTAEWREVVAELVELLDPEEGSWPQDLSTCPYYRRGLPGADPNGQCSFSCRDEPECQTFHPREGWPLERARALLAAGPLPVDAEANE